MRNINVTFTDEEINKLKIEKGKDTWHDFILKKCITKKEQQIEGGSL